MWVVLEVLRGSRFFLRDPTTHGIRSWAPPAGRARVAAATVVGLSGVYYVAFTLLLLAAAMLARRWQTGSLRGALPGVVPGAVMMVVFMVPVLVARWGARTAVLTGRDPTQRSFVESDFYAGKMMDLVLPYTGHRVDPLAFLAFAYNTSSRATVEVSALGVIGAVGWVALVVIALSAALGASRPELLLRQWSVLTLIATALYTVGGLGAWIAPLRDPAGPHVVASLAVPPAPGAACCRVVAHPAGDPPRRTRRRRVRTRAGVRRRPRPDEPRTGP